MPFWGIVAAVIAIASSAASYYKSRQARKKANEAAADAAAVQISETNSNRALYTVYGEALVGSTVIWKHVTDRKYSVDTTGTNFTRIGTIFGSASDTGVNSDQRWFYRAVALCSGPIHSVTNVLIDGAAWNDARFSVRQGNHFATVYSKGRTAGDHWNRLNTGTALAEWDSTKTGKGVAHAIERLYLGEKSPAYQGEPSTQYLVKGRLVYDPRKDTTYPGGSGAHRTNDPSTWEWSDNPALCLLDYLTNTEYGRGLAYTTIDLATIVTAANACDVTVAVPARLTNTTGSSYTIYWPWGGIYQAVPNTSTWPHYRPNQDVSNTQKRYRLNVALDGSKDVLENVKTILNVFRANLVFSNGKYKVIMEDVASPVMTLTDDDVIGGLEVSSGDRSQRMNRCTVKFLNDNKNHKEDQVSWPSLDSGQYATYLAEDQGEALHQTVTLHGCTDYYQAEDFAEFMVRDSRKTMTVRGTFMPRCAVLEPGDVVQFADYDSASFLNKFMRVVSIGVDPETLEAEIELRDYDSSVYSWNAAKGNEPLGFTWNVDTWNAELPAPTFGTRTSALQTAGDGSTAIMVTVNWSGIPNTALSAELLWGNSPDWNSIVILSPETQNQVTFQVPKDNHLYDLRLRYRGVNDTGQFVESAEATSTVTTAAMSGSKLGTIESGATVGARLGTNLYDTDGVTLLQGVDILNDDAVLDALPAINANPSFRMATNRNGVPGPVGWITLLNGIYPTYVDTATRDVIQMRTNGDGLVGAAIRANPGTTYEFIAAVKAVATGGSYIDINAEELDTDLPSGKRFIGVTHAGGMTARTRVASVLGNGTINTSTFTILSGDYVPTSTCKWFSPRLYNSNSGNAYQVEWFIVRTKSRDRSILDQNIYAADASTLLGDIDVRNDQLVTNALGAVNANPSFELPRRYTTGNVLVPASWYRLYSTTTARYEDEATRDVLWFPASDSSIMVNSAFPIVPGTRYKISLLAKLGAASASPLAVRVHETTDNLGEGKYAICSLTPTGADLSAIQTTNVTQKVNYYPALTTSYAMYEVEYIPGSTAKWASVVLADETAQAVYVDWCVVRSGGATLGSSVYDSAGSILADVDVLNDRVVLDHLPALNANASFQASTNRSGVLGPADWITSTVNVYPTYEDDVARDVVDMPTTDLTMNGAAIRVNPGTVYEFVALVKATTTGGSYIDLRAEELTTDLPTGKKFIGIGTHAGGMQARSSLSIVVDNAAINTSTWTVVSGDYSPSASAKWMSPSIYNSGSGNAYKVEWFIIRDKSTAGATWNVDVGGQVFQTDDFNDNSLTRVESTWEPIAAWDTAGAERTVAATASPNVGNYVWRWGNNSGVDEIGYKVRQKFALEIVENKLYKMTVWVRFTARTSGSLYAGPAGLKGDVRNGNGTPVTWDGADNGAGNHNFVIAGATPTVGTWTKYEGYFIKDGTNPANSNDGGRAGTAADPKRLHSDVEFVVPFLLGPYLDGTGTIEWDFVDIRMVTSSAHVEATIPTEGALIEGVGVDDGGTYRPVTRALGTGTAGDGDSITFSPSFSTPPVVKFLSGGLSYWQPWNASSHGQSFEALNVSGSGFTARLKLKQTAGSPVLRTDSTVSNPGSPAGVDLSINKGQTAEAYDDKYTFQFDVTITNVSLAPFGGYAAGNATIGIYTNDGGGWVQRTTKFFSGSSATSTTTYSNQKLTVTVDAMGLNDDFGISIESTLFGASITFDNVTYYTATAPSETSATPAGASDVEYLVLLG